MTDLLEMLMILCFGLSWPLSIYRSWVSRSTKGKSLFFEVFLWVGYVFGILRKILLFCQAGNGDLDFLFYLGWVFYCLNIIEITIDILLYFRNRRIEMSSQIIAAVHRAIARKDSR
ncbi:MAG: hypothetical protein Q4B70_15870 [Lachnospiraceae bacterium]|nr:hypothetical protein [Lachnospiraceae bacterium]